MLLEALKGREAAFTDLFFTSACAMDATTSCCRTLLREVPSNLGRDLTIRHLVGCFNTYDAPAKAVLFKTFFQFAFCLTRTKYQDRLCITNRRNHRIVVDVEMLRTRSLEAILCWYLVRLKGTLKRGITGTAGLLFNFRYNQSHLFPVVRHRHYLAFLWSIHKPAFVFIDFSCAH